MWLVNADRVDLVRLFWGQTRLKIRHGPTASLVGIFGRNSMAIGLMRSLARSQMPWKHIRSRSRTDKT